jgi:hypothetical protein
VINISKRWSMTKSIMALLSTRYQRIVYEMEVSGDFAKPISKDLVCHVSIPETRIFGPVIIQGW